MNPVMMGHRGYPPDQSPRTALWAAGRIGVFVAWRRGQGDLVIADTLPSFLLHSMDFWFESDTIREVSNMISTTNDHSRTSVHPLFSILTFIPVYLVKHALAISSLRAVLYVTSIVGGLWIGTLYLLLRLLGCRMLDASVFTILACPGVGDIWLPVPLLYVAPLIMMARALSSRRTAQVAPPHVVATRSPTHRHHLMAASWPVGAMAVWHACNSHHALCLWCSCGAQSSFSLAEFSSRRKEATWIIIPSRVHAEHFLILCVPQPPRAGIRSSM